MPPVTQSEIARRAGVARPTVSRVLNGRLGDGFSVRPDVEARILRIAKQLGYRVNTSARAIRLGRFNAATLLMPHAGIGFLPSWLLHGVEIRLAATGMHLNLTYMPSQRLADAGFVPKMLRELGSDGLLVNYLEPFPESILALIHDSGVPAVWLNTDLPQDCVRPADREGGRIAARRLVELGHRRIAFIHWGNDAHYSFAHRVAGCRDVVEQAGGSLLVRSHRYTALENRAFDPAGDERARQARDLLRGAEAPTAVITYDRRDALVIVGAALTAGLTLGRDLSLVSFDWGYIDDMGVVVDTVEINGREVGGAAVDMLRQKIDDPQREFPVQEIPLGWFRGQTCGPPEKA